MRLIADLHIHSHYSRATGRNSTPAYLERWARIKGIDLLGTGDCTHPRWLAELREHLEEEAPGLYTLKKAHRDAFEAGPALAEGLPRTARPAPRFVLTGEISTIYKEGDRTRKIHHLVILPDFKAAGAFQIALEKRGNISSDGRPILGIDSRDLLAALLDADHRALLIPAHIWTPWFSALGAKSGFDSIEACYGSLSSRIPAVETGLSSNPPMNWALASLDDFAIVSNSDAHSPEKIGREATVFDMEPSYGGLAAALWSVRRRAGKPGAGEAGSVPGEILETIEFFPQEGKYHYDGHRKCGVYLSPEEAAAGEGRCPVCGKALTRGVMGRVLELADRPVNEAGLCPPDYQGSPPDYQGSNRRPYRSLVPLKEILGEILGTGPASKRVNAVYGGLIEKTGGEFPLLLDMGEGEIEKIRCPGLSGELLAAAIRRMRRGEVSVSPGYDGEYGVIRVFSPGERFRPPPGTELFGDAGPAAAGEAPNAGTGGPGRSGGAAAKPAAARAPGPARAARAAAGEFRAKSPGGPQPVLPRRFSPDEAQEKAAAYPGTQAIIIAGPGTGKTSVLAARIARLIGRGRDPASILALSFTVKAAAELRERIAAAAGEGAAAGLRVATFHSLCCAVLREELRRKYPPPPSGAAGPGDFRIIGDAGRDLLLGEIAGAVRGKSKPPGRRALSPQKLGEYIEERKRYLLRPGETRPELGVLTGSLPPELFAGLPEADPEAEILYGLYRDRLRAGGLLDFEDLPAGTVRLLAGDPALLGQYRSRYRHILVDEYQDVNFAQYVLIRLLAPETSAPGEAPPELWVIGDPNQAIYGFRGADKRFIDRFPRDYPGAARFRLTRSFRCAAPIISAAGRLVEGFLEGAAAGEAAPVSLFREAYPTDKAEAEGIARRISRLIGGSSFFALDSGDAGDGTAEPASPGEIAVLLRGAALAGPLTKALGDHGIPYELTGEKPWWEEEPVNTLLAELREKADHTPEAALSPAVRSPGEAVQAAWEALSREGRLGKRGADVPALRERLYALAALYGDLPSMLDALALSGAQGGTETPGPSREGVRVMTIHASKGLEFDHVFVPALEEGLLPFTLYGDKSQISGEDLEEERRLLYVAMTRARRGLYLSRAESRLFRGRRLSLAPSRFWDTLAEIPLAAARPAPRRDPQPRLF